MTIEFVERYWPMPVDHYHWYLQNGYGIYYQDQKGIVFRRVNHQRKRGEKLGPFFPPNEFYGYKPY